MNFYCTGDEIGTPSGGGAVTYHELESLKTLGEVMVFSRKEAEYVENLDSPFLFDYFANLRIEKEVIAIAHFYSWVFSQTVHKLKERGTLVTYTVPAHDRSVTIEEFRILGMDYPFQHIKNEKLWSIFKRGYVEADLVIAPSKSSATFLEKEGCKVMVIPHGCYPPDKVYPLPDKFQAGYLGQVGPDKGVHYLIKAWEMLGYTDAELVIAGPGTEAMKPLIEQNVGRGNFKLWGFVDSPSRLYNSVNVYIQPSSCEAFGIEILEAMAHGRAVVASKGAGASELIVDGETGFVVPIRNPKALAEKIDWLRRNPRKAVEMGLKGREIARNYTWDKICGEYREIWTSLLDKK